MTVLNFAFAFVLMLGVLITVHEFGHFIVAKLCGVRVLKFSIGFGNPIGFGRFRMRWLRNGTEYVLAWLPLGGYVKMLGELPGDEESPEAREDPSGTLAGKPIWQKLAVVLAGPAMNLLLPVLILMGSLWIGMERPAAVIGAIEDASPSARMGLRPGDRILAVDGEPVRFWHEVERAVRERPGEVLRLQAERGGQRLELALGADQRAGLDIFQKSTTVGWLGLQHRRVGTLVGIPRADAPAAAAGLRSGDRVRAVNGQPVEDWVGFEAAYTAAGRGPVELEMERGKDERVRVAVPALGSLEALGLVPASVLVSEVTPDSAAGEAGLRPGDLIVAVDGRPVGSFASFAETVRASEGRTLHITVAREGRTLSVPVTPRVVEQEGPVGRERAYMVGIRAEDATLPGVTTLDRERNPLRALPRAAAMTAQITALTMQGVAKIVTGEIERNQIGGPIEIARQAHSAMKAGWERYLELLVLISVNLAILNLIPIPVLDGGQAMLFLLEAIKRGPLSVRTREIAMQIGVTMVLLLMGFAFWNDLSRYWDTFLGWLRQGTGL